MKEERLLVLESGEKIPFIDATPIQISQSIALINKKAVLTANFVKHLKD